MEMVCLRMIQWHMCVCFNYIDTGCRCRVHAYRVDRIPVHRLTYLTGFRRHVLRSENTGCRRHLIYKRHHETIQTDATTHCAMTWWPPHKLKRPHVYARRATHMCHNKAMFLTTIAIQRKKNDGRATTGNRAGGTRQPGGRHTGGRRQTYRKRVRRTTVGHPWSDTRKYTLIHDMSEMGSIEKVPVKLMFSFLTYPDTR